VHDTVLTPNYFGFQPELPIQIWINLGDGTLADESSWAIVGPVPVTGFANSVFVADLNGTEGLMSQLLIPVSRTTTAAPQGVAEGSTTFS